MLGVHEGRRREAEKGGLHVVCMSSQGQLDVCIRKYLTSPMAWVMAQKYLEHAFRTCRCFFQAGMVGERRTSAILDTDEGNAV